jgi:hypothetical protein
MSVLGSDPILHNPGCSSQGQYITNQYHHDNFPFVRCYAVDCLRISTSFRHLLDHRYFILCHKRVYAKRRYLRNCAMLCLRYLSAAPRLFQMDDDAFHIMKASAYLIQHNSPTRKVKTRSNMSSSVLDHALLLSWFGK